jgi:hypothetical protein
MSHSPSQDHPADSDAPGDAPAGYEPPRITPVGSLRDLVGKSGPLVDAPGPDPRRGSG